jgi:hypothetical protein
MLSELAVTTLFIRGHNSALPPELESTVYVFHRY